jgi:NAD(P)-dependent dehydrogenase (short-subunit alcohol dehydrogenase family)
MCGDFAGKVIVITGGASGIGRASAILLARRGARVAVCDINEIAGNHVINEIRGEGGDAEFIPTDVTDENQIEASFRQIVNSYGCVDVLHNCAGGSTSNDAAVDRLTADTIEQVFRLDLRSVMLCSREALPGMIENGGGSIINMSSFVAFRGVWDTHAYTAAKGAIAALTRTMAGTYAKLGVRVNAIAPGAAMSERTRARLKDPNVVNSASYKLVSFDDYPFAAGTPEEIAHIVLFLSSDESRLINGQTIVADGGMSAY